MDAPADEIAVIGMAGRFPGSDNTAAFWRNLAAGNCGVTDVTPNDQKSSLCKEPNYVAKAAVVKDADHFDAKFFGIYPKQAIDMDPQHRLFLEICWHALEDAGYVPDDSPSRIGVFAGCHMNTYIFTRLAADPQFRNSLADSFPGGSLTAEISNDKDYLASRVAFELNLRGPCVAIQSACSTSLVAVAQACENLASGACEMALAGGVTITFPQEQGYLHTEDSILSPDGTCRTFDANAKGTIFGDGVGAVVLKRLSDAIADRDDIYAVIRGWGVNNDGAEKTSYTAPSVSGQLSAIRQAHKRAGITADTISYVEAHGTGTLVGDPIEVQALTEAFRETTDKVQFCRIGSLKSNVGHLDVAAGVAGLIKTSLALKHQQIPALLHFQSPNPKIDFASGPFVVNTALTPWQNSGGPRRAGISSFGVGGTNAHLVMQEAPVAATLASRRPYHLLTLSARCEKALDQMTEDLAQHLSTNPDLDLGDVAHTLQTGRKSFRYKRFVVAASVEEAADSLRSTSSKRRITGDHRSTETPVVFMFPGQGSQHRNMASELYQSEPVFAEHIDECAECLTEHLGVDLRTLIDPQEDESAPDRIDQTEIAQPALFLVSYALGRWWQSLGIRPSKMIGHSVGEFAAAALAGIMSMEDAAKLVAVRGRLMQNLPRGSMIAVQLTEDRLRGIVPESLEIAAVNGPEFCVVSGRTDEVENFAKEIDSGRYGDDIAHRALRTSHAFHSRMMDPAIEPFAGEVRQVQLHAPKVPVISTVSATPLSDAKATDPLYWARQIREPVRYSDALQSILHTGEVILLEVGPSQALSTLARQQSLDLNRHHLVPSLPHAKQVESSAKCAVTAAGQLWKYGATANLQSTYSGEQRRRVHLPLYRFQRSRYTFHTDADGSAPKTDAASQNPATQNPATQNAASRETVSRTSETPAAETPSTGTQSTNTISNQSTTTADQPLTPQDATSQSNMVQTVIHQQIELMNRQMELLREVNTTG